MTTAWIQVKDKLPPAWVRVLVYCAFQDDVGFGYVTENAVWVPDAVFEESATDHYDSNVEDNFTVTHWAVAPNKPEEYT